MTVTRRWSVLVATLLAAALPACAAPAAPDPDAVRPAAVALPAGAVPEVLATSGDALLVGVRRDGPGLLRRTPDGVVTDIPIRAATGYGRTASWYALTADGPRVLGVGGDRGGAHGNVRWSVWTGTVAGVAEHAQAFTTFGGWGAGDLVGAAFTPAGPALVGSWQSDAAGLDVAVWTPRGDDWERASSTGTPLASTRTTQGFAVAATACGDGVLVAGWQVGGGAGQAPVVWRSTGAAGWVRTPLPDAGAAGSAAAVGCVGTDAAVTGRVDGRLALWRPAGGGWTRVPDLPPVAVGDRDALPAPLLVDGRLVQLATDRGVPTMVEVDGSGVARRPVPGLPGPVTAAVAVGSSAYVLAGDPARLWRLDLPPRRP